MGTASRSFGRPSAPDALRRGGYVAAGPPRRVRVGRVSGYQFIGLSQTTQNTYSNMRYLLRWDAMRDNGQNCDKHRCRRSGAGSSACMRMQRTLNDLVLKLRDLRATTRFSLIATEERPVRSFRQAKSACAAFRSRLFEGSFGPGLCAGCSAFETRIGS